MDICMVDYDINPPWVEGARILACELSRQLIKEGHNVHVVTSAAPTVSSEEVMDGIRFHRIRMSNKNLFKFKQFIAFSLANKLKKLHKLHKFDVIHIQNSLICRSFTTALLALRKSVRAPKIAYVCLHPINSSRDFVQFLRLKPRETLSRAYSWLVGTLTPKFYVMREFSMVDKIVTTSNRLKTLIGNLGIKSNNIDTIYPFINTEDFALNYDDTDYRTSLGIDNDTPLILYVGSTEASRLGNFLKALPIVLEKVPDSKVVLVSSYTKQFSNFVAKLGLQNAFISLPMHVEINMPKLMATCDVYTYPGFSGLGSMDPPLTLIEAMALGVPIAASNTGGIPEIAKNSRNCFLFDPFDYQGMANSLIKILKDKGNTRSERKLRTAHPVQSQFDSRLAARRFISIYEQIIGNRA